MGFLEIVAVERGWVGLHEDGPITAIDLRNIPVIEEFEVTMVSPTR